MTSVHLVGEPCGSSGIYTFYKTFGYTQRGDGGLQKSQSIGSFFFVRISAKDDPCIGELQLLWDDGKRHLASVRLYFLPEQTPDGRQPHHGQHEVLAASERVIMRLEDLVEWITEDVQWDHGLLVKAKEPEEEVITCDPIEKDEFSTAGCQQVLVLSYSNYCRYRAMLSRLNNQVDLWLNNTVALALGIVAVIGTKSYILFCRDTFHHEGLLLHDLNLDHLAPVLKGKTRKRRIKSKRGISPDADSNTSDDSKDGYAKKRPSANGIKTTMHKDEQTFLQKLFKFMKDRRTPILRVPHLGFKQIDLYLFYKKAQKFGGYDQITHKKSWKNIYDEMGGDPGSTSAATCTRKHYERLLLPFERHLRGEVTKTVSKSSSSLKISNSGSIETCGISMTDMQVFSNLSEKTSVKDEVMKNCKIEIKQEGLNDEIIREAKTEAQRITEEGILKIKLEKLPVHEQHGKTTELWQQKTVSPRKFLSEMVTNKEFKWNEIRKKNAMARSWARQRKPAKSPTRAEYFQQILVPQDMISEKTKVLHLDKVSTNSSTLSMQGVNTIPPLSSTMMRLDNSRKSKDFLTAMVKTENTHTFVQCSAKETTKHPVRGEKISFHSEYPLSVSCPPPRNSTLSDNKLTSTSAMKCPSRRNSVTCSSTPESLESHKDSSKFLQNSEVLRPSKSESFSALYSPRLAFKQSQTLLEFLSSDRCNRKLPDDKPTPLSSNINEGSQQADTQEASTSHRRPSVILHTEQIRSPPITIPNTSAGDIPLKTSVGLETCTSFYIPSYSEDTLMKSLHLRPISVNETKIIDRQLSDQPKFPNPNVEAICIKSKHFTNIHSAKAKENISTKSSAVPSTMLQDSGKTKKEHCSKASSALNNRKLQRVSERTTANTHRHSKPHRASLSNDTSFIHAVERTVPVFKNSVLPKSSSPRRLKASSVEQHRLKHSIPPVLSSPFISSLSRSAHLSYKPSPYINFPNNMPNCTSVENDEVLDLSVKRNEKIKSMRIDSSFAEECLDLSVKKKIPSPDTSGLPSGIENITPPPPLTGEESSVASLPFSCFTPLDGSQFYQRLINNATVGTFKDGIQSAAATSELITSATETPENFVVTKSSNNTLYACTPMNYSDKQPTTLTLANPSTGTEHFLTSNPESQLWLQTVLPSRSTTDQPSSSTHKESNVPKKLLNSQTFPPQLYPYLYNDKQYYSSVSK